ncbi:MAG: ABC transporter permease [Patescibacteria group bacterium]
MKSQYWNLIKEFAISDFKLKYQGSVLGYFWSLIKPLLMFGFLYLVFSIFLRFNIENYRVYLLLGIIMWTFFAECTSSATSSLISKGGIIQRVNFSRKAIVIASSATSFITFLLNLIIFIILYLISGLGFSWTIFIFILFVVELYFVALGLGFLVASLNVKWRDLSHIWEVLLQVGFWLTPIIWSVEMVPVKYHFWIYQNPLARIIQYSRDVVINHSVPSGTGILASLVLVLIFFFLGYFVFQKRQKNFAEEL